MAKILQIIILIISSFIIMSSSCDKGSEGCTDTTACNYYDTAVIDDNSCWFASEGCDCDNPPGSIIDCLGICDADAINDPPVDSDGHCCASLDDDCDEIVVGGCIDKENCNYDLDSPANYNDGSCAVNLSVFGGLSDGKDCNGDCNSTAVMDGCDLCVGGATNYGQCWQIEIESIAMFKLQDGTSMGSDTNLITIGTSKYALNGYNGVVTDDGNTDCEANYNDVPGLLKTEMNSNKNNFTNFFIPHEDEWDEWGSQFNLDMGLYFNRDIRANDYHSLFSEEQGITWFSVIEPTLSDTVIIDSIKFQITHLEGIKCSLINIYLDREKGEISGGIEYVVEDNQLGIEVESDKAIHITINVSNICIREQEFDESCPDNY